MLLRIPERSSITGAISSDCLLSYPGHSLWRGGSYSSTEMQSVYSTAPPLYAPCFPAQRVIWFGHMVWICHGNFSITVFFLNLINWRHPKRWVALASWLKFLILAVDLRGSSVRYLVKRNVDPALGLFTLLQIHYCTSCRLWCYMRTINFFLNLLSFKTPIRQNSVDFMSWRYIFIILQRLVFEVQ